MFNDPNITTMGAGIRVLHVDEPAATEPAAEFLHSREDGFEVDTARTASDAVKRLEGRTDSAPVDCVVSGYDVADADGLELLERVRETDPDLPFILFTGERSEEIASEAIARGVDGYLEKRAEAEQYALLKNRVEGAVEQYRARNRVERLHEASRTFMRAQGVEEVCESAIHAVEGILDFPLSAIWLYDQDEPVLRPVAASDGARERFEEIPAYTPGNSLSWQAFESGETVFYQDIHGQPGAYDPDTPVESELVAPLGEHGVMNVGSTQQREMDDIDRSLADLLAANVEAALDRAAREEARTRSERRFRTLFEQSVDAIFLHTADGEIVEVNARACELLGYDREELVGMSLWDIGREPSREELRSLWNEMSSEEVRHVEGVHRRADGSEFHVEVRVGRIDTHGEVEFFAAARDVSEQRERELELQRQNERLQEFAGVVSHDLRNPLHVAEGRLQHAMCEVDSDHLEAVAAAHDRMETLIDDLLTLAREGDAVENPTTVSLRAIAEDSWETVQTDGATLVVESDRRIKADPQRLRQLFENLFRNAVEHAATDSDADTLQEDRDDTDVTITVGDVTDGFFVADDGCGIPPDERERVFESGYTTSQNGTGFGLRIVQQIAKAHDWSVDLTSSLEGGTRFEFTGAGRAR